MDNASYTKVDQATNGLPESPRSRQEVGNQNRDSGPGGGRGGAATSVGGAEPAFRRLSHGGGVNRDPRRRRDSELDEEAIARMEGEGGALGALGPDRPFVRGGPVFHQMLGGRRSRSSWWQRESLTVADVMTTKPRTVELETRVPDIAEIMRAEDVGVVPVVRGDGRLWGIVTDRDIVVRGIREGQSIKECRAKDLATTDVEVVAPNDSLSAVIELMGRERVRRVPVIDQGDRLVGIVALGDIANRADYHEDLQDALEKISGRRSFWSRIWR